MAEVSSSDLRIDSLDVIADIEAIQDEIEAGVDEARAEELDERMSGLLALSSQGESFDGWENGIQLIHEDDFEDYAKELIEDVYGNFAALPDFIKSNIDWSGVADELSGDYSQVEFEGVTFFVLE